MEFSDPIVRAKKHLAEITGGQWVVSGFSVRSIAGYGVGTMQRTTDAIFVSEAPVLIAMLLQLISESRAEAKKARYEVSADRDQVTTLKDQLANAISRRDELERQLNQAWEELERHGRKRP